MEHSYGTIGMIGFGRMGNGIAANLLGAGYDLVGYDRSDEALDKVAEAAESLSGGFERVGSVAEILERCDTVITCLRGRDSVPLYEETLIRGTRKGQVVVDHATIPIPTAKRFGKALADRGVEYMDVAISGGLGGASKGTLRMFAGGKRELFERYLPMFEVVGNPEKIVYCGEIGDGQKVKVVQQMTRRFPDLARVEVIQFGLKSGLDIKRIRRGLDVPPGSSDPYDILCREVESGEISKRSFEFSEWEFYFEQARAEGFRMPMLEALFEVVKAGELVTLDGAGRPEPSVWDELMKV